MELSIGLPDGLLMRVDNGSSLTLYESDHTTVRRHIDTARLEGASMVDIVWSHKLSAVIAAVPERHQLFRWDGYVHELQEYAGTGEKGRRDGKIAQAKFASTSSITESGDGRLWLVDKDSSSLRYIEIDLDQPDGGPHVVTVVGRHGAGYKDGPADQAQLNRPQDLQVLYDGSIVIADTDNHAVRHLEFQEMEMTTLYGGPGQPANDFEDEGITLEAPTRVTVADSQLWVEDAHGRHMLDPIDL